MLRQLRQSRYQRLAVLMLVVAIICIAAGTWQISRLIQKHDDNNRLRANAHQAIAPLTAVLQPAAATGSAGADSSLRDGGQAQFRSVSVSGTYRTEGQLLVRDRSQDGNAGYFVLTRLVTAGPPQPVTLLVVRGFIADEGADAPSAAAPPAGAVTIVGRIEPSSTGNDHYSASAGEVRDINVLLAQTRLESSVYSGYVELLPGQPGTTGLTPIADPDLSNPAGGAVEWQHLAYVVQWYLFALLALAAPFVLARYDSRDGTEPVRSALQDGLDGFDELGGAPGRPALTSGPPATDGTSREVVPTANAGAELARTVRSARDEQAAARAAKMADRYGSARRR